jgi:hypothetical protein
MGAASKILNPDQSVCAGAFERNGFFARAGASGAARSRALMGSACGFNAEGVAHAGAGFYRPLGVAERNDAQRRNESYPHCVTRHLLLLELRALA